MAMGPMLTLPRIHADVPGYISRSSHGDMLPNLARALLLEGVLKPTDWQGDLAQSVDAGVRRWVTDDLQAGSLGHYTTDLHYTTNFSGIDELTGLHVYSEKYQGRPIGTFALVQDERFAVVEVGYRILELERLGRGVGFNVLALLEKVVNYIGDALTPGWAWWTVQDDWEMYEDAKTDLEKTEDLLDDVEESGMLTPMMVADEMPVHQFKADFSRRAIQKALNKSKWTADQGYILHSVLRLDKLYQAAKEQFYKNGHCDYLALNMRQLPSLIMKWEDTDAVERLADDHLAYLGEDDYSCVNFSSDFDSTNIDSIRAAIRRIKLCIEMHVETDSLLGRLHSDLRIGKPVAAPVETQETIAQHIDRIAA